MNNRKVIKTPKAPKAIGPYSIAVQADNLIFTAGQLGLDPQNGEFVDGGIEAPRSRRTDHRGSDCRQRGSSRGAGDCDVRGPPFDRRDGSHRVEGIRRDSEMNLTDFALRNRTLIVVLTLGALYAGFQSFNSLPRLEDPEFTIKEALVITPYPGATPYEVEEEVSDELERAVQKLGKIKRIEVGLPQGHTDFARTFGEEALVPPPPNLDYEFWVGPAPWWPYCKARVHMNWRWNMDFGGGQLMDWIGHHLDIAHWGMGWDTNGPAEIEGTGRFPTSGIYNSPTEYYLKAKYTDGTPMIIAGGHNEIWGGTKWIGEYGWIWVNRADLKASKDEIIETPLPDNAARLEASDDHMGNFFDCVRSRKDPICHVGVGHRSASICHLGAITLRLGRKVQFDPDQEEFVNDEAANRMRTRAMREPWCV